VFFKLFLGGVLDGKLNGDWKRDESTPRGLFRVLADEDSPDLRWLGNGFQSLGVGGGCFRSGLTVGEAAVTFEDCVSGAADFVEEAQGGSFGANNLICYSFCTHLTRPIQTA